MASEALYMDVYRKLLADIQNGEYQENMPLPPETVLSEKYHVSRNTIRRAFDLLKNGDIIYSVHGNGSYIKPQTFTQPLSRFYSFTDTLKSSNILIQNTIVEYDRITCDRTLEKETGYPQGTRFHKLTRLRSAQDYPLMLETTYLPQSRFMELDLEALATGSLYDYLRKQYRFHVTDATETFRPVMPRPNEVAQLHIAANVPCILLERFSYESGILVEYTKSIVRGDKYVFRIELPMEPLQL